MSSGLSNPAGACVAAAPWGKAAKGQVHPLVCHCIDTTLVAELALCRYLGPGPLAELRAAFEPLGDADLWIALFAGLHDIGKHTPMFQLLREDVARERFAPWDPKELARLKVRGGSGERIDTFHGGLTAVHIVGLLERWGADRTTAKLIAVVLGGHHGHFPTPTILKHVGLGTTGVGGPSWTRWRDRLVTAVINAVGLPEPEGLAWDRVRFTPLAATALAALTTISDWIASDTENFPYGTADDLTAYTTGARRAAAKAIARLNWVPWSPPTGFKALFGKDPRPMQEVVEKSVRGAKGPALVIIEAPPGDGKSKAAIHACALFSEALGMSGMYLGNPTQATTNQLYLEIDPAVAVGAPVALVHSAAKDFLDGRGAQPSSVDVDGATEEGDRSAREWFTRKKALLTPIGVGTVDQVLKTAIRSGHVFVRLLALSNKTVVIDEVHGYSTYMSTLLDRVLAWLGRMGVPVVLMSATLPSGRRDRLIRAWRGGLLQDAALPVEPRDGDVYPRITVADAAGVRHEPADPAPVNERRTLHLKRIATDEVARWAVGESVANRAVAVVHNLVRRVTDTVLAIHAHLDEQGVPEADRPRVAVLTGRLAAGSRRKLEEDLRGLLGRGGTRPDRGLIVVGTQVLELGLDLDFDAMCTDVAPVDAMIQRAGRLHRHRAPADGQTLTLAITGVQDTPAGPRFPGYLSTVYEPMIMMRTWAALRDRAVISLPGDIPTLVDDVYSERLSAPPGWADAWSAAADRLKRNLKNQELDAANRYVPHPVALACSRLELLTAQPQDPSRTRDSRPRR
ncbi:CRISPR-associated helicase Cas3' [Actinokineospora spheciospongiae]|uniref:CRISPR-associated helicase Cas3' n=1 Tax=Actinokineospora spheciospongiae TaxID=909613 RepID=UPI000D87B810|nr:CRISPR-associated helicase Cas3' [Actinokineospora spheciospongiae]PWW58343.1 CRISPR-associated Cas3 family helicase [Actinokineospora spheciospongiae]